MDHFKLQLNPSDYDLDLMLTITKEKKYQNLKLKNMNRFEEVLNRARFS